MNSNERVFLFIFSIVTMNVICCAFGQYEPLYMSKPDYSNEYYLIYNVRYNIADQKLYVVESLEGDIISLCPRTDDPNSLEIRQKEPKKIPFIPDDCETSIKSDVYFLKDVFEDMSSYSSVIGFLRFTPDSIFGSAFNDVPQNHKVVEFIHFRFDKSLGRIRYVEYEIGTGKHLKPEISTQKENNEYQKNENIFGYDVDKLYSQSKLPMVKVQLAPEDDFFYANLKSASRHNILTAPMWRELLPQWQALEIFIRKVTQVHT
ncbi:uncharacterized protein LOC135849075 [Planococcus citri]|uniref:uncharacterized protein LOC135849075 n=1 Tax=Planococcus citri TaxID=170843 RepID=UPI0031F9F409